MEVRSRATVIQHHTLKHRSTRFHRSMTRPFFNRDRISDFEIFEKHADDAIWQLRTRLRQGYPVDFQVLTLVIYLAAFAHSIGFRT